MEFYIMKLKNWFSSSGCTDWVSHMVTKTKINKISNSKNIKIIACSSLVPLINGRKRRTNI